ncbi:hypothetical protein GW537_02385 [Piscirickettsia salmonis]|uniref:hypothetical protein n=1 Tax=Piscirickettsia salmonis TaxID=1238 RepID=UPI0002E3CF07|nr:hypothetical protein [Piscirickettsia salmonis]QHS24993.1 hypothetical protein GW538_02390 [Piscirickettsia salmonis]QHS28197.1 hypothetical protein GW537_02385 [Piscirickettsia salmonis]
MARSDSDRNRIRKNIEVVLEEPEISDKLKQLNWAVSHLISDGLHPYIRRK